MVSSDFPRHGEEATAGSVARSRSTSTSIHQPAYIASLSGGSSFEAAPTPVASATSPTTGDLHAAVAQASTSTPSCLRQEMTSMTLIGLLQRGHQASPGGGVGDARLQRPTCALSGRRGWVHLLPDYPHPDATGPGRLQRNRRTQQVLEEAFQAMAGLTAEDAATATWESFAPQ